MNNNIEVFKGKDLSNLLLLIYLNQKDKSYQIVLLIDQLKNMVTTVLLAILLVPSIASYLTIGVKNDLILIKLVTNITKMMLNELKSKLVATKPGLTNNITDVLFELLLVLSQKLADKLLKLLKLLIQGIDILTLKLSLQGVDLQKPSNRNVL